MSGQECQSVADWLREKSEQVAAAKRNLHGLSILVTESDTQPGRSAMWMDNGLAGVGQAAVSTGEFPCQQTDAIAALANVAASFDFAGAADLIKELVDALEETLHFTLPPPVERIIAAAIAKAKGGEA